MIEAKKLAYADMLRYVCDPKFTQVPVAGMLSKDYARERAKLIDLATAKDGVEPGRPPGVGTDTTYLCAVDEEGNMVSYIQSNYATSARAWWPAARVSCCRIAAGCSAWTPPARTCWPGTSGRCIRSFPRSPARTRCALRSGSWAAGTSRRRMRSSCPTSWTTR